MPGTVANQKLSLSTDSLEVVARDGIEPSTRGFSVRRSPAERAPKPKKRNESRRAPTEPPPPTEPMPNPARPAPTETRRGGHAGQRVGRIATERGPNTGHGGDQLARTHHRSIRCYEVLTTTSDLQTHLITGATSPIQKAKEVPSERSHRDTSKYVNHAGASRACLAGNRFRRTAHSHHEKCGGAYVLKN